MLKADVGAFAQMLWFFPFRAHTEQKRPVTRSQVFTEASWPLFPELHATGRPPLCSGEQPSWESQSRPMVLTLLS